MPQITNPQSISKSTAVQSIVRSALLHYSTVVLNNQTPILSPNTGWKASQKRIQLAQNILSNVESYVEKAALFLGMIDPNIEVNDSVRFRYLIDENPSNRHFCECTVSFGSWEHVGESSGKSIWDNLAGVTQTDLL